MTGYPALRLLTITVRILAALALVATALVTLAILGDFAGGQAGAASTLVWALRIGAATLVALSGLLLAALLYAVGEVVTVLLAIEDNLRRSLAALDDAGRSGGRADGAPPALLP